MKNIISYIFSFIRKTPAFDFKPVRKTNGYKTDILGFTKL
jgi:hypothetical protein